MSYTRQIKRLRRLITGPLCLVSECRLHHGYCCWTMTSYDDLVDDLLHRTTVCVGAERATSFVDATRWTLWCWVVRRPRHCRRACITYTARRLDCRSNRSSSVMRDSHYWNKCRSMYDTIKLYSQRPTNCCHREYDFTGVEFPIFLLIFAWALQQWSATALPVITTTTTTTTLLLILLLLLKFLLKWPRHNSSCENPLQNLNKKLHSSHAPTVHVIETPYTEPLVWSWWVLLPVPGICFRTVGWYGDRQPCVCAGKHHAADSLLWCEVSLKISW